MVVFKIAFRSVLRYKGKLVAIGLLIAIGIILLMAGQSFVHSLKLATKDSIINNYTGHLVLYSAKSKNDPNPFSFSEPLPPFENYEDIVRTIEKTGEVKAYVPIAQNFAIVDIDSDIPSTLAFDAIDPENYKKIFHNIEIVEGSFFDEPGILINESKMENFRENGIAGDVGDVITLMGTSGQSSINAVKVKIIGIYKNKLFQEQLGSINYMDIQTYKTLFNFQGLEFDSLPDSLKDILSTTNEDDIFGDTEESDAGNIDFSSLQFSKNSGFTMIMVLLKDESKMDSFIQMINDNPDLGVKAANWRKASAGIYELANSIQIFITIVAVILFITVAIIMMNTFIINILERTYEIGTIRAIGGKKSFIATQYILESMILTFIFGLIGVIVGSVLVNIFGHTGIMINNELATLMYGGGKLYFSIMPSTIVFIFFLIIVVSVISTLYPVAMATKITPLKAMSER